MEEGKKVSLRVDAEDNVELIHLAIQQLLEEKRGEKNKPPDEDQLLLSRLLSQLESLKENNASQPPEPPVETKELPSAVGEIGTKDETVGEPSSGSTEMGVEEIVKELKKVKRQNSITHWLLSMMIFLTVAWQLSEVSLILMVKNKVSQPFRSLGSMVTGMLKNVEPSSSFAKQPLIETPQLPTLKIPELPRVDLPALSLDSDED